MRHWTFLFLSVLVLAACARGRSRPIYPPGGIDTVVNHPPSGGTAPGDALSPAEQTRAVDVATRELRERGELQPQDQWVSVGTANAKSGTQQPDRELLPADIGRQAIVTFFRYSRHDGLHALVDLRAERVADAQPAPAETIPIGQNEVQTAAGLALRNAAVVRLLGGEAETFVVPARPGAREGNAVEGLRVVAGSDADPCFRARCVDLFFSRNGRYLTGPRVTVNLTTQQVIVTEQGARP